MRRDRACHCRQRDFKDAKEVDAEWIERTSEIAILVIGKAAPVLLGNIADGDRLMVGVGDVVAQLDGAVGVVDVAQAIEARIERADKISFGIVDGRRQPALGVVAKLIVHRQLADVAPDRRRDVDEKQREQRVDHCCRQHVAQRSEFRIESDGQHQPAHDAPRHRQAELAERGQMPQKS